MLELGQPPTYDEVQDATALLETLSANDTLQFETHPDVDDNADRDAIQIWGVEETESSLLVNLSDPDVPVNDWDRAVEYLHVTHYDRYTRRPAARIEQFDGAETTHVGYIRGIDPEGDSPTILWEPV